MRKFLSNWKRAEPLLRSATIQATVIAGVVGIIVLDGNMKFGAIDCSCFDLGTCMVFNFVEGLDCNMDIITISYQSTFDCSSFILV